MISIKDKIFYISETKQQPTLFDVVYCLGPGSTNFNEELRYSLRSLEKFAIGLRNVFVVGYNPGFLSDKVIYIPTIDPYPHDYSNKDRNHWHNLETACSDSRLCENFLFAADDNIILKKSTWNDFAPRHTGLADTKFMHRINNPDLNFWSKKRIETLQRFDENHRYLWHPHMFSPINKTKFLQCCKDCDYRNRNDVIIFTYYYNHEPMPKLLKNFDAQEYFEPKLIDFKARHISHNDKAFSYPPFKEQLQKLFPIKSKYEKFDIDINNKRMYASIIIPCFNAEKYLDEAINSVINNNCKYNYEIICIDDGSTDKTSKIIDAYCKKYINVKKIQFTKNKGLSAARNAAIEKALGKYIVLLDADDKFEKNALSYIIEQMEKNQLDIFYINAKAFFDSKKDEDKFKRYKKYYNRPQLQNISTGKKFIEFLANNNNNDWSAWLNIFRKEFLIDNNIKYKDGAIYEDLAFNIYAALCANTVFNTTQKLYNRRVHENSIVTRQKSFKDFRSYLISAQLLLNCITTKTKDSEIILIKYIQNWAKHEFNQAKKIFLDNINDSSIFNDLHKYSDSNQILTLYKQYEKKLV